LKTSWERWTPPFLLIAGALLLFGVGQQQAPQLRAPLAAALPDRVEGMAGEDAIVSDDEAAVAGFTDYALRVYAEPDSTGGESTTLGERWASIYLGFYDSQTRGRTIHSPKNCLPGSGWDAISSTTAEIEVTEDELIRVNRYILQNGEERALVLYWYQGRGRVAHNEYLVKWDLLRDAALKRRTDEALVRIVVPVSGSEAEAYELAAGIARDLIRDVGQALPAA
jgi:EpsI family protein